MDPRYSVLIDALEGTVRDLLRLLRKVDEQQADIRPSPEQWCIKDVVAHLTYCEAKFQGRFERILAVQNPLEPEFGPDPLSMHDLSIHLNQHIEAFALVRARTSSMLRPLSQAEWLRTCQHASLGQIKLRKMVEIMIGHDNEHLAQIVSIREFLEKVQ